MKNKQLLVTLLLATSIINYETLECYPYHANSYRHSNSIHSANFSFIDDEPNCLYAMPPANPHTKSNIYFKLIASGVVAFYLYKTYTQVKSKKDQLNNKEEENKKLSLLHRAFVALKNLLPHKKSDNKSTVMDVE